MNSLTSFFFTKTLSGLTFFNTSSIYRVDNPLAYISTTNPLCCGIRTSILFKNSERQLSSMPLDCNASSQPPHQRSLSASAHTRSCTLPSFLPPVHNSLDSNNPVLPVPVTSKILLLKIILSTTQVHPHPQLHSLRESHQFPCTFSLITIPFAYGERLCLMFWLISNHFN